MNVKIEGGQSRVQLPVIGRFHEEKSERMVVNYVRNDEIEIKLSAEPPKAVRLSLCSRVTSPNTRGCDKVTRNCITGQLLFSSVPPRGQTMSRLFYSKKI